VRRSEGARRAAVRSGFRHGVRSDQPRRVPPSACDFPSCRLPHVRFPRGVNLVTTLRDFVSDLLQSEGAIVEVVEPDGLDVRAPEPLRPRFGWPDLTRLGFGAGVQAGAIPIGLEDDWLDRLGALLGERGRVAVQQIAPPVGTAPPNNPERLIAGA